MIIYMHGESIEECDEFLCPEYKFNRERIRAIKKRSGLTIEQFAKAYGFSFSELSSWLTERKEQRSNLPLPASRVKLAFIEASLWKNVPRVYREAA
jgi:DNA-binding transcriptional regulator YiaG